MWSKITFVWILNFQGDQISKTDNFVNIWQQELTYYLLKSQIEKLHL